MKIANYIPRKTSLLYIIYKSYGYTVCKWLLVWRTSSCGSSRFHAVFWPAFLLAAGLDPPERVISHAHWTMGRHKMSKSRGNVVDPFKALEVFGTDVVRYFLLKEGNLHNDGGMCWWSSLCVCGVLGGGGCNLRWSMYVCGLLLQYRLF